MAAHRDPPPFDLGHTLEGTDADGNLINKEVVGKVYTFPSYSKITSSPRQPRPKRSEAQVTCVAMRNVSGSTLYGKRLASLQSAAGPIAPCNVDGYATTLAQDGVVFIDEFLATAGVAQNDIFWAVVRGPVLVLTPATTADVNGNITYGTPLVACTAYAAGATTAGSTLGRVSNVTLYTGVTGATAGITQNAAMASNVIARALSSVTTGNTNSDLLVNACLRMLW